MYPPNITFAITRNNDGLKNPLAACKLTDTQRHTHTDTYIYIYNE